MSENPLPRDLMERLGRVDSKLEKLLAIQTLQKGCGLSENLDSPEEEFSEELLFAPSDNNDKQKTYGSSAPAKNPLPSRVSISAKEADSIFQKVEKINRDVEVMERVENLERQNRKMVLLGSIFMTLAILMLGVSTFLMFQANLVNKEVFLHAWQRVYPYASSSGEASAKVTSPQPPKPIAEVHEPKPVEPIAKVSDPQPVAMPIVPKPAEATAPGKYVGSITSNKYHYPGCKWAAQIRPNNLLNFSTIEEARKRGYIPCPTCKPPHSDQEKLGP